jgi:hypothetical protein
MKVKYLTRALLIDVNEEAVKSGRSRTLHTEKLRKLPEDLVFPVGMNLLHNDWEIRAQIAVGPSADKLQHVWLDMPIETFNKLPEVEV